MQIQDIELRVVKRSAPNANHAFARVQWRKLVQRIEVDENNYGRSIEEWTDWQDAPVVSEEAPEIRPVMGGPIQPDSVEKETFWVKVKKFLQG
jgi:hypothetical protein